MSDKKTVTFLVTIEPSDDTLTDRQWRDSIEVHPPRPSRFRSIVIEQVKLREEEAPSRHGANRTPDRTA